MGADNLTLSSTTGNFIFNPSSTGNVGIGITTPAQKLDVAGTTKTLGFQMPTGAGKGYVLTSDTGGTGTWAQSSLAALADSLNANFTSCANPTDSIGIGALTDGIAISGNYVYVVDYVGGDMKIFNITNGLTPVLINTTSITSPTGIVISGNYAYVSQATNDRILIYDVTNPTSPVLTGFASAGSLTTSVAISNTTACVVDYNGNDIRVYDVSNPASPVQVGSVATGTNPTNVINSGTHAYVIGNDNNLRIFDISNPANPSQVGIIATGGQPYNITINGIYAYIIDLAAGDLRVYNISSSTSPTLVTTLTTGIGPSGLFLAGSKLYISRGNGEIRVYSVSNPANPVLLSTNTIPTSFFPYGIVVSAAGKGYVNERGNGFNAPGDFKAINFTCSTPQAIYIDPNSGGLSTIGTTVSNSSNVNTLSTTVNGTTGNSVAIVNAVSNTSSANTLSTTVNGVTGSTVPMVNAVSNTSSANSLTTTVNGVAGASVNIINSVSNSSSANQMSISVNGSTSTGANIINTNALSLTGSSVTSTVNGVASNALDISPILSAAKNVYNTNGTLTGTRTITMAADSINFNSTTGDFVFNPSSTGKMGIGTSGPLYKMHLLYSSIADGMMIQNTVGGGTGAANLFFGTYGDVTAGTSHPGAKISAIDDGSYSANVTFSTKTPGLDANALTERMRLTNTGNLAIGTNNPLGAIDISASYFKPDSAGRTLAVYSTSDEAVVNLVSAQDFDQAHLGGIYFSRPNAQSDAHINVAAITARQSGTGSLAGGELLFFTKPASGGTGTNTPSMEINTNGGVSFGAWGDQNVSTNGYAVMGGMIIQWGTGSYNSNSGVTVTFPKAFNNLFSVTATVVDGTGNGGNVPCKILNPNGSTFQYAGTQVFSGDNNSKVKWIAIGN